MKVKVVMPFTDKATKKTYKPGDVIDVSEKRYAEIRKAGRFVERVKEAKVEAKVESGK